MIDFSAFVNRENEKKRKFLFSLPAPAQQISRAANDGGDPGKDEDGKKKPVRPARQRPPSPVQIEHEPAEQPGRENNEAAQIHSSNPPKTSSTVRKQATA